MIIGFVSLRYHNHIYAWSLDDIESLYAKAERLYREAQYEEARKVYKKLAGIDSANRCQYILGDMYFQGQGGKKDYDRARKYFVKAAEGGNANAQNNLGYIYTMGIGTDTDFHEAKKWLRMAAAQSHPQAMVGLGSLYRNGWGVLKDHKEAFKLYRRAAAHGNTDAMNNLGYMHTFGYGTYTSIRDALYYIQKSAALNNPVALYNMATFHIEGLTEQEAKAIPEIRAPYDTDVYCPTCNKTVTVKVGEVVPFCCGRLMEILD